jgi:hypothetical protein
MRRSICFWLSAGVVLVSAALLLSAKPKSAEATVLCSDSICVANSCEWAAAVHCWVDFGGCAAHSC